MIELIWANYNESNCDHIFECLGNIFEVISRLSTLTLNSIIFIFKLVNELSIYSQVNDSNNEEIMSTWLKSFIEKTLETSNSSYFVNYLIKLLNFGFAYQ